MLRNIFLLSIFMLIYTAFLVPNEAIPSLANIPIKTHQFIAKFSNFESNYSMLLPASEECPEGTILLVTVLSKRNSWDRRNAIRQSYAKHLPPNQAFKFIIGQASSSKVNATEDILLAEELHRFGDIIFYGMEDSYDNLTLKVLALMQWQQAFCAEAKFLLKIDDDLVADLPRLGHWIERKLAPQLAKEPKVVYGHVLARKFGNAQLVIRDPESKWHLSMEDYPNATFPEYMDGPAYLLSTAAVKAILEEVPKSRLWRIEDALFTGVLRERAGVALSDQEPFIQIYCGLIDCPGGAVSKFMVGPRFNLEDVYTRLEQNYKRDWNDTRPVARIVRTELNKQGTELNCRLGLQKRCSGGVPITSVWCPGDKMKTLDDYKTLYGELHSIKCELE